MAKEKPWYKADPRYKIWRTIHEKAISQQWHDEAPRFGWRPFRTHNSKYSDSGWPDLTLIRPPQSLFFELKMEGERPTVTQWETLHILAASHQSRCFIAYPHDADDVFTLMQFPEKRSIKSPLPHVTELLRIEEVFYGDEPYHCRQHGWVETGHRCKAFGG